MTANTIIANDTAITYRDSSGWLVKAVVTGFFYSGFDCLSYYITYVGTDGKSYKSSIKATRVL